MTDRDLLQKEAILAFKNNGYIGTLVIPTGVGKTRIGALIHLLLKDGIKNTLVVSSRVPLLKQWKKEFENTTSLDNVDFMCINSAFKLRKHYDLVIIDEVHRALSPLFKEIFKNLSYKYILGLTATLPDDVMLHAPLKEHCPVVFEKTIEYVLDLEEVFAPYLIYNIPCTMDKKTGFAYRVFNQKFNEATIKLAPIARSMGYKSVFELAQEYAKESDVSSIVRYSKQFWSAMTMRKQTVYSNPDKIGLCRKILLKFPERKWLILTKSITFAEKVAQSINGLVYHSKLSKEEREEILAKFASNECRRLVAVDALNEGLNIPDADSAICLSGVSTELVAIQQLGRISRFEKDKKALFINLYTEDTVEKRWVETKTQNRKFTKWITDIEEIVI